MTDSSGLHTKRDSVPSATRALRILETLAREPAGMRLTDLASQLGLPASSVHLLLAGLADAGWVERIGETKKFGLGVRVWEVGHAYVRARSLADRAQPVMDRMRDGLGETVRLAVLDGHDNVYIAKSDGGHALTMDTPVGSRMPAHVTGIGKVLLAGLPPAELKSRLESVVFTALTPNTIMSSAALTNELRTVRQRGWAEDREECILGVRCIAVPVCDHTRTVVAGLSTSVPTVRFNRDLERKALELLIKGAGELGRSLGAY